MSVSLRVLTPEAQLLLRLGAPATAARDEQVRAIASAGLDWPEFAALAQREHAAPVVWPTLARLAGDRVPPASAAVLGRLAMVSGFHMADFQQRLARSTRALADAGVPCALLKGAALASTVYGTFGDRPMADLDLLVPADRVAAAHHALLGAGWADPPADPNAGREYHHLPALVSTDGIPASLELHTEVLAVGHPFGLTAKRVLADARPADGAAPALVPSRELLLVHACVHFMWQHAGRLHGWRAIRDVLTLSEAGVDWTRFAALAAEFRAATCCYWTLRLARDLVAPAAPSEVLAALRPPHPARVRDVVARHLAVSLFPSESGCPSVRLRRQLWTLAVAPRWSGHGGARPWRQLTISEAEKEARGVAELEAARRLRPLRERTADWLRYGRAVAVRS